MSPSIQISEETMSKLEVLRRDDETFDELLVRLTVIRTEADVREMAGFADEGIEESMKQARSDLNQSLERRKQR